MRDNDVIVYTADGQHPRPRLPGRTRLGLLVGVAALAAGLGLAGGWLLHEVIAAGDGAAVPAVVVEACGIFNVAYEDASALAEQANEAFDQDDMANPVSANEVWRARHQAAAEEATELLFNAAENAAGRWLWLPIAFELDQAQRVLGNELSSSVEEQQALAAAAAACLGR